jgi:hypothetical protein
VESLQIQAPKRGHRGNKNNKKLTKSKTKTPIIIRLGNKGAP